MTIESDKEQLPDHLKIKYKDKLDIYDRYMALNLQNKLLKNVYTPMTLTVSNANDFDGNLFQ